MDREQRENEAPHWLVEAQRDVATEAPPPLPPAMSRLRPFPTFLPAPAPFGPSVEPRLCVNLDRPTPSRSVFFWLLLLSRNWLINSYHVQLVDKVCRIVSIVEGLPAVQQTRSEFNSLLFILMNKKLIFYHFNLLLNYIICIYFNLFPDNF